MNEFFKYLLTGLGFACFLEALPWLISPEKMREFLFQLAGIDSSQLRYYGYFLLLLGVFFVWLARP